VITDTLDMSPEAFAAGTGWSPKPEGLCQGDVCVPAPGSLRTDGSVDGAVAADRLGMPVIHDDGHQVWAIGPASGGRALATATAPSLVLQDRDGNPFDLTAMHGKKVLLVAWASW
jgi:hypothetical protein